MPYLGQPYSYARWDVKEGKEEDFVAAWDEFAHWTKLNIPGAEQGILMQDLGRPNVFISIGPWKDMDSVSAWRSKEEFKRFFATVRELCDDITTGTMSLTATSD